jgi:hypothetical protein
VFEKRGNVAAHYSLRQPFDDRQGATAAPGMKPETAEAFAREAPHVEPEVVDVVRAICRYIWKTYGRFPAHCHAIDSAGIWMQCHHIDPEFYDRHFRPAYSSTQAAHATAWHGTD